MDKTLNCRDCGAPFVFTAGEQEFFAARGFANPPSRCPNCRAANKARRNGLDPSTAAPPPPRPPRQTFSATCARCGKQTEVPFEPRLGRPVYCRDCFVPRERTTPAPAYASAAPSRGESFAPRESERPRRRSFESRDAERYEKSYEKSYDYGRSYDGTGEDDDEDSEFGGGRGRRSRRRA